MPDGVSFNPAPAAVVYVLGTVGSGRRLTYVGWTNDLTQRLARHNQGTGARFTRGRRWILLHSETFADRREAQSREWHLKRDRALRRRLLAQCRPDPAEREARLEG